MWDIFAEGLAFNAALAAAAARRDFPRGALSVSVIRNRLAITHDCPTVRRPSISEQLIQYRARKNHGKEEGSKEEFDL